MLHIITLETGLPSLKAAFALEHHPPEGVWVGQWGVRGGWEFKRNLYATKVVLLVQ